MMVRTFLPRYSQPDADAIRNLGMAIVVDQKRLGGGSHSTMGTITDTYTLLRQLFALVGEPFIGYANVFSFNEPIGMCPECNGIGRKLQPIVEKFYRSVQVAERRRAPGTDIRREHLPDQRFLRQ